MSQGTENELAVLNWAVIERDGPSTQNQYRSAHPFPHIVIDDFLQADVFSQAISEFDQCDAANWIGYVHVNEKKYSNPDLDTWGDTLQAVVRTLNSARFLEYLGELTGIEGLI